MVSITLCLLYNGIVILLQYHLNGIIVKSKKPLPVYLDETEREKVELYSERWGVSLSAAIKRMVREYDSKS